MQDYEKRYEELYEKLMNCNWFEKCGSQDVEYENLNYIWAKNVKDVEKSINSVKWENTCIEEMNGISDYFYINGKQELLNSWNDQAAIIKKLYIPKIEEKIKQAIEEYSLPEGVHIDVRSNVLIMFIGEFFSEYYHSEFYERLLEIYLSGHLPCGYKGKYRQGSIIIY